MSIMDIEQQTAPTSVSQEDQPRGSMDPNTMAKICLMLHNYDNAPPLADLYSMDKMDKID
jgi:hypothetical protein